MRGLYRVENLNTIDKRINLATLAGMNIVNVTGNCLVIYRPFGLPDFGIYGIAVSTVVSQVLAVLVMFRILFVHMDNGLRIYIPRPFPFGMLKKIFMIGVPGGGMRYSSLRHR